jgi:outer membrane protein assembly factor BamA
VPAFILVAALLAIGQPSDRLASVQIQGNQLTPDSEILQLAGIEIGMPVAPDVADVVARRLRDSSRFESVEVLRRFASIADPSQIALVILVDEGAVTLATGDDGGNGSRLRRRRGPRLMYWPILDYEDGRGLTYGVRISRPSALGDDSRVMFPLSLGARKSAAAELQKDFGLDGMWRVQGGLSFVRREHLYFELDEDRTRGWGRLERALGRQFRAGAILSTESVTMFDVDDRMDRVGADVTYDTRIDPWLARNAVMARAAWDHLSFGVAPSAQRIDLEAAGYLGVPGQSVLVVRAQRRDSNHRLPAYERPLLGGASTLRGYGAGSSIGDTMTAASIELRVPLTSPLSIGKAGVSAFTDLGTIYDKGRRLRDQAWKQGTGGSFWISATVFRFSLSVAHGRGASTRVQAESTVLF